MISASVSPSPSPPQTPDPAPIPVLLPPSRPPLPSSRSPKHKKLPRPFQNDSKTHSTPGKEEEQRGTGGSGRRKRLFPKPRPKNSSSDIDIAELKSKLQVLHSTNDVSTGSMFKRKSLPKSPPLTQRAIQATKQPLLPPVAKPRKSTQIYGNLDAFPSLTSGGSGEEERGKGTGASGGEKQRKKVNTLELEKNKLPLKSPQPLPRGRVALMPTTSPTHLLPTLKARLGNREKDRAQARQDEGEELSPTHVSPARPIPRARSVSKGEEAAVPSKGPVPRKRISKDNLNRMQPTSSHSISSSHNLSPAVPAPLSFSPSSSPTYATPSTPDVSASIMKIKKGGSIRMPLWSAPPPPKFSPPSTPTGRANKK